MSIYLQGKIIYWTRLEHNVNPDIIVISELKPKNHRYPMTEADFKLDGYDTFKCNIDNKVGRGMIIYTKPDIDASQITSTYSSHSAVGKRVGLGNFERTG